MFFPILKASFGNKSIKHIFKLLFIVYKIIGKFFCSFVSYGNFVNFFGSGDREFEILVTYHIKRNEINKVYYYWSY